MRLMSAALLCVLLAGCGQNSPMPQTGQSLNLMKPDAAQAADVQAPQIAYSYALAYTVGDARLAGVQAKQVALCTELGAARCQVAKTSLSKGSGGGSASGETNLLVDARIALAFQKKLDAVVNDAGGEVSERSTTAEDITKQVVDTDARVRAKQALADRLMKLISESNGKVADLVAAEQAFSTTQEELDAARSLQASLRQRVAMSDIAIRYDTREATGTWAPVWRSIGAAGESFVGSIAALVTFIVVALPWVVVLWLLVIGLRRLGLRWPFLRRRPAAEDAASHG
jgi:hypothetical protein